MRLIHTLPLIAGFALAACGDGGVVEDPSDPDQIADAVSGLPTLQAGEYAVTGELVEFSAEGVSDEEIEMARGFMSTMFAQTQTQCITEDEAAQGYEQFVGGLGQDNDACEMQSFESDSNSFSASMTCDDTRGNVGTMAYAGEVSGTSMEITMTIDGSDPQMGDMHMAVRLQSERVGECSSGG